VYVCVLESHVSKASNHPSLAVGSPGTWIFHEFVSEWNELLLNSSLGGTFPFRSLHIVCVRASKLEDRTGDSWLDSLASSIPYAF